MFQSILAVELQHHEAMLKKIWVVTSKDGTGLSKDTRYVLKMGKINFRK